MITFFVEPEVVYGILGALLGVFVIASIMLFVLWRQAKSMLAQNADPVKKVHP